ncbi:MAG: hypothetical protein EP340_09840 [Alphaproteobacteria bacterium]|nr:MAG: hypothetical protein EP340_09840 [Alphaproteobacteria bacterium]
MHSVIAQPFEAPREELAKRIWWIVRGVLRLILPVSVLFVTLILTFLMTRDAVVFLDIFPPQLAAWNPSAWLTVGHLMLPLSFFVINMTNRKYGALYAYTQVAATWVLLGAFTLFFMAQFGSWQNDNPFPPMQTSVAFLGAFGVAQVMLVSVFDKTRGRTWWGAPLISVIWASVFYVVIFHVVANWGLGREWMPTLAMDFVIKSVEAILLLVPYQLMRRSVKPLPGYGGA